MPALLFASKPERCPYGHSLAPGMPQKISWLPCICEPAREAETGAGHGPYDAVVRDMQRRGPPGHQVLRATARGRPQPSAQRLGDAAGRLSASDTTARATCSADGRGRAVTAALLLARAASLRFSARFGTCGDVARCGGARACDGWQRRRLTCANAASRTIALQVRSPRASGTTGPGSARSQLTCCNGRGPSRARYLCRTMITRVR
jgi:hypothetical protein